MDTEKQMDGEESLVGRVKQVYQEIRRKLWFQAIFFVLVSLFEYLFLEWMVQSAGISYSYGIMFKNILIILALQLLLTGIFHGVRTALLLSEFFFLIVGAANHFVIAFRGYGIVFMDLYAVRTAANVAGGYRYDISPAFAILLLCNILLILGTFFGLPKRIHAYRNLKYTFLSLVGIAVSALFFLWINVDTPFFKDVSALSWDHSIGMRDYGYVLYFLANAGKASVDKPKGYSAKALAAEMKKYESDSDTAENPGSEPTKTHPNLIMIMNESFSDLRTLGELQTEPEVLSFYDSLQENTIKGTAYSSVYGGYTANSEFEFLTGCSKLFFPGSPYLQYIDDYIPSLIWNLKSQGYEEAIAIHPYHPSGYSRNRVYPLLGFDRFLSLSDFEGKHLVRDYIGDLEDYQKIEELYEQKKKGTSLCVFNVTMQNHNAYDDHTYVFEEPVRVTNFAAGSSAEQYLSLMRMSDQALKELITYFSKEEEPTMILLFGDHQPHLQDSFYKELTGKIPALFSEEEIMDEHKIPFLIWANYEIPERKTQKTSINYLSTLLLETAGLKLTGYQRYLQNLQKTFPVVSATGCYDASGELYHYPEEESGQEEKEQLLRQYEMLCYHYIFDPKNRMDDFFGKYTH